MRHRRFKRTDTGEWLDVVMTSTEKPGFSTPAAAHQQDVASGFGLALDLIEVVEAEGDPVAVVGAVPQPVPPETPQDAARKRLKAWLKDPARPAPNRAVVAAIARLALQEEE